MSFLEARASHGPGLSVTRSLGHSHFSRSLFYIAPIVQYGPVCSPVVPYGTLGGVWVGVSDEIKAILNSNKIGEIKTQ